MNRQQKSPGEMLSREESFNLMFVIAKSYATCLVVFTRHTFGKEALGFNGLGAFLIMPLYGTFGQVPAMFDFWGIWLLALIFQRARTMGVTIKGTVMHSRFGGYLWLGSMFGLVKSSKGVQFIEFLVCLGIGLWLKSVSPGVGSFVIGGSVALLLVDVIENQLWAMKVQSMRDAEIEMRELSERYQGNRTDF